MKSFLTKVGALLMTVVFAFAGCQDYDEDIRKVNEQLNTNTAELTTITEELEAAIEALEAKVANDYATKAALEELKAALQAKDTQLSDAIAAIDAAYKAADAALKSGYETADANLQKKIDDASKAATEAIETLTGMFERTVNQLSTRLSEAEQYTTMVYEALNAEIEKLKAADTKLEGDLKTVANNLAAAKTELEAADAAINTRIDGAIANIEKNAQAIEALTALHKKDVELLQGAIAENSTSISALQIQLRDLVAEYEQTVEDLQGAIGENTALIESVRLQLIDHINTYNTTIEQLENQVTTNEANITMLQVALNALTDLHATDVELLQAAIAENTTAIEAEILARINAINELKELHTTDVNNLEEVINDNERKIGELQFAVREMQAVDEDLQNQITELDKKLQTLRKEVETYYALKTDVTTTKEQLNKLEADVYAIKEDVYKNIEELKNKVSDNANKIIEIVATISGIQVDVEALMSRIQSLVYAPEYLDGNATLQYAYVVANTQDETKRQTYIPAKSLLRYKVNAEDAAEAAEALATAYNQALNGEEPQAILSYTLESVVATRAATDATLEIVEVDAEDEYLLVYVVAKDFADDFFAGEVAYSASLRYADGNNNRATEYTGLVPAEEGSKIGLTFVVDGEMEPDYSEEHEIAANDTTKTCDIFEGVTVEFTLDGALMDADDKAMFPTIEFEFEETVATEGDKLEVEDFTLTQDEQETKTVAAKLAEPLSKDYVGDRLLITHNYSFEGHEITATSSVEITAEQIYCVLETQTIDWTLQTALDLRGVDGTPYAKTVKFLEVPYAKADGSEYPYNLKTILDPNNFDTLEKKVTLNGKAVERDIRLGDYAFPARTATVKIDGYEFPENGQEPNVYVVTWVAKSTELYAEVVDTIIFNPLPAKVVVDAEVDVELVEGETTFTGRDTLVVAAYNELGAELAGFAEDAPVYQTLFDAIKRTDDGNAYTYTGGNANNIKLNVVDNVDRSNVNIYENQFKGFDAEYNYQIAIDTWFGVDFEFNVTANAVRPANRLVPSDDYMKNDTVTVYGKIDTTTNVYTINLSDLGKYLGVSEEIENNYTVQFEVLGGATCTLADDEVAVTPVDTPVKGIYGELATDEAILDWAEWDETSIKVKAVLVAEGAYTVDEKEFTLVTRDPLTFDYGTGVINVDRYPGEPATAYVYQDIVVTSYVEPTVENLLDQNATSFEDVFTASNAGLTYGLVGPTIEIVGVYSTDPRTTPADELVPYSSSKWTYKDTTGQIILHADDGGLLYPIYASFKVSFEHNVHGSCVSSSDVLVVFTPKN